MTYFPKQSDMKTAFGEKAVAEKTPQVQVKFPYGINTDIVTTLANNAGSSVTSTNGYAIITCAAATEAHAQLKSLDNIRYGPGQGATTMFTAAFITGGVANSHQLAGAGNGDEGFFFGYNGTSFGILRRELGSSEIKSLAISNTATGTGNITITLDNTAVTVAITSGWTVAETVEAIVATVGFANAGRGWETHTHDDVSVEFTSFVAENAGGTFSFVDTDTTGVAGVFSEPVAGVAPTESWVAQTAWNGDVMDGTGQSKMILDQTMLNVFCIQFQYLGAGKVIFQLEASDGNFTTVHTMFYANTAQIPTLVNPTLHLSLIAQTNGSYAGAALEMRTASLSGFIEGKEAGFGIRKAVSNEKSMTTTEQVLLILHNKLDFASKVNKISVYPDFITLATEASKPVEIIIWANPTRVDGGGVLTDISSNSVMQHSGTGTTIVGGSELAIFQVETGASIVLNFKDFAAKLRPGDRWVVTGRVHSGSSGNATAGFNWLERI